MRSSLSKSIETHFIVLRLVLSSTMPHCLLGQRFNHVFGNVFTSFIARQLSTSIIREPARCSPGYVKKVRLSHLEMSRQVSFVIERNMVSSLSIYGCSAEVSSDTAVTCSSSAPTNHGHMETTIADPMTSIVPSTYIASSKTIVMAVSYKLRFQARNGRSI